MTFALFVCVIVMERTNKEFVLSASCFKVLLSVFTGPGPGVGSEEENVSRAGGVQPGQTHADLLQLPEAATWGPHVPDGWAAGGCWRFHIRPLRSIFIRTYSNCEGMSLWFIIFCLTGGKRQFFLCLNQLEAVFRGATKGTGWFYRSIFLLFPVTFVIIYHLSTCIVGLSNMA